MKHITLIITAFFTLMSANIAVAQDAYCDAIQEWVNTPPEMYPNPSSPYTSVMVVDNLSNPTPYHWMPRVFSDPSLGAIEQGYGTPVSGLAAGIGPWTDLWDEHGSVHDLTIGDTLYFRKWAHAATTTARLISEDPDDWVCEYSSPIWMYVVPSITTSIEGMTVRVTDLKPQSFWIFDTQGGRVREGVTSSDTHVRMPTAGIYILRTEDGFSKRFFVSD